MEMWLLTLSWTISFQTSRSGNLADRSEWSSRLLLSSQLPSEYYLDVEEELRRFEASRHAVAVQDCRWKDGLTRKVPLHPMASPLTSIQQSTASQASGHIDGLEDAGLGASQPSRLYLTDCSMGSYEQRDVHPDTPGRHNSACKLSAVTVDLAICANACDVWSAAEMKETSHLGAFCSACCD